MQIESGKFYDISNWEYHHGIGSEWISKSFLSNILDSPRKFKHEFDNPESLDIFGEKAVKFNRGTVFHTSFLEPEKVKKEIVTIPEFSGKGSQSLRNEWKDEIRMSGQTPIKSDYLDVIKALNEMLDSGDYEVARNIIRGKDNFTEKSGFWEDPETGLRFKVRPDLIQSIKVIWDLKTHASIKSFRRQAMDLNYDLQAVMCLDGVTAVTGTEHTQFGFIVFHVSEPPYDIEIVMADEDFIRSGREKFERAKGLYMSCVNSGKWPGKYEDEVALLSPTRWRMDQLNGTAYHD